MQTMKSCNSLCRRYLRTTHKLNGRLNTTNRECNFSIQRSFITCNKATFQRVSSINSCQLSIRYFTSSNDNDENQSKYLGVNYNPNSVKKYSAELDINGHIVSGGEYWTAIDAAKAYDELVDLYGESDDPRNFPQTNLEDETNTNTEETYSSDSAKSNEWMVPDVGNKNADLIPIIPQTYFTLEEVLEALKNEKAENIYTVNLVGRSNLMDYMVFTTCKSPAHMKRLADLMINSLRARQINDDFDYAVEGRDCDDWMIADCNNIVIHFMDKETRKILNLEDHWEHMVNDKHEIYGDMTADEYMDKFGISPYVDQLDEEEEYIPGDSPLAKELMDEARGKDSTTRRDSSQHQRKAKDNIQWK